MICRKQFKYQSKLYSFANCLHFEVLDVTSTGLETKNETAASTWATVWRTATVKCRSPIPLSCKGHQYPSVAKVTKTPKEINPRNDDLTVLLIVVVAICFIACITISCKYEFQHTPSAISKPFI